MYIRFIFVYIYDLILIMVLHTVYVFWKIKYVFPGILFPENRIFLYIYIVYIYIYIYIYIHIIAVCADPQLAQVSWA